MGGLPSYVTIQLARARDRRVRSIGAPDILTIGGNRVLDYLSLALIQLKVDLYSTASIGPWAAPSGCASACNSCSVYTCAKPVLTACT